jgi:hypothetical protein
MMSLLVGFREAITGDEKITEYGSVFMVGA